MGTWGNRLQIHPSVQRIRSPGQSCAFLPAIKSLNKAMGKIVVVCSGEKHGLTYFQNRVLQRIKYIEHLINKKENPCKVDGEILMNSPENDTAFDKQGCLILSPLWSVR